ncbi:MAG: alpha-2-macroglobulin family protein [Polyangiales bacterium]
MHRRTIHLDSRPVPTGSLRLGVDRPWAAAGERVTVTATPSTGANVRAVDFSWPGGRESRPVSDGAVASVSFVMPTTSSALERFTHCSHGAGASETVAAQVSLWTGRLREVLSSTRARRGAQRTPSSPSRSGAWTSAARPPGPVQLGVYGSTATAPEARPGWTGEFTVAPSGDARCGCGSRGAVRVGARGAARRWPRRWCGSVRGPRACRGAALALLPPTGSMSRRGEPRRAARRRAGVVTLEQGGVWSSAFATPGRDGMASLRFDPPAGARGVATLVATRVHLGRVETASAVAEVASSQRFALTVDTDRTTYPAGATARVIVRARTTSGAPRSAVLSMWLEDAGWWSLGEDRQPSVDAYFRATGRPASGGDSTRPLGFGSEEGRRSDSGMFWNGERLPRTTFRHAWGHGSAVVSFRARGDLSRVASELARAAGLNGASMCAARVRPAGTVDLEVRELPWDLVAARLAERTNTWVRRDAGGLRFACTEPEDRGDGMGGMGSGRGAGGVGVGRGGVRTRDREQLTATQWFLPARRIDATGELRLEVPLPAAPGRWRLHALAIADDGAGSTADADLDTVQQVAATLHAPRALAAGDVVEAEVLVRRNDGGSVTPTLRARRRGWRRGRGRRRAPRVRRPGRGPARRAPARRAPWRRRGHRDHPPRGPRHRRPARGDRRARRPRRTARGLPRRAHVRADRSSTCRSRSSPSLRPLRVELDGSLVAAAEALSRLRSPCWHLGALQLDRYASLRALESLATRPRSAEGRTLARALRLELAGAATQLRALCGSDGELAWWSQMQGSHALTATALALGADDARAWADAWTSLRAEAPRASGPLAARLAAALSRGTPADRALVGPRRPRRGGDLEDPRLVARAARAVGDALARDVSR